MRSVAYALLGFGVLAFGALTPAPASADCYRNCEREYRPIHRHRPVVRYERYERRPVHRYVHRVLPSYPVVQYRVSSCCGHYLPPACCGHSYYQRAYFARPAYFARSYVEDSVPYEDGGYVGYSRPYANGYYVSGIGGFGGSYRGLVSWHRFGQFGGGYHGFGGYRHAGFGFHGGLHRFR